MVLVVKSLKITHNRWPRFTVEVPYGIKLKKGTS